MARSTLWKHRKFRRLEMAVKSKCIAAGVLECLWSCGYESGDDLIGSSDEVERACGWHGKRGTLTAILLDIGWIDESPDGYRIHDLYDHAPDYVKRRRNREDKRRGHSQSLDRSLDGQRPVTDRALTATPLFRTPTQPNPPPTPNPDRPREASGGGSQATSLEQPEQPEQPNGHSHDEPPVDVGALVAGIFPRRAERQSIDEDARREELKRQAREITTAVGGAP